MQLLRIALLSLDSKEAPPTSFTAQIGAIRVDASPVTFEGKQVDQVLLTARVHLAKLPTVGEDNHLVIPDPETSLCEQALETVSNVLA